MPNKVYNLDPVERLTADAVGAPGERVFYIQARKGATVVTVRCEKEQVAALHFAVDQFLQAAAGKLDTTDVEAQSAPGSMELEFPLEPVFTAGQVNLGYEQASKRLVVIAYELLEEGAKDKPSVARFWASPAQMRAFSQRAREVVSAGRPRCAMCGEPISPGGHFCPRKNGHGKLP